MLMTHNNSPNVLKDSGSYLIHKAPPSIEYCSIYRRVNKFYYFLKMSPCRLHDKWLVIQYIYQPSAVAYSCPMEQIRNIFRCDVNVQCLHMNM